MTLQARLTAALDALGIGGDDRIGVACSGGADSVALVHLLARSSRAPLVTVLHVNHGLRDEAADDESFARTLARDLRLGFASRSIRVERGDSLEAGARDARYAALDALAGEHDLRVVLTAHTLDDQAETVLLKTMRGASTAGIAPVRGRFVRPLLSFRGAELRAWLTGEGLRWREDTSNDDQSFERNWVRHTLLPQMRERRPGIDAVLARTADRARADDEVLGPLAREVAGRAQRDEVGVFVTDLDDQPQAIAARVVVSILHELGATPRHDDITAIVAGASRVDAGAVSVWRTRGGVAFIQEPVIVPDAFGVRLRIATPGETAWRWRTPVGDADASSLSLRARRPGDRVRTAAGTKKVQDVLVDAKVPQPLRDLAAVLVSGDEPLAVVGLTTYPASGAVVVDAEPVSSSWSTGALWRT